ncbi:MAG: C39 family peptidase [Chloroflexi bacterium]|nr:C39 family peptidase [Chloroflexota bacterium]
MQAISDRYASRKARTLGRSRDRWNFTWRRLSGIVLLLLVSGCSTASLAGPEQAGQNAAQVANGPSSPGVQVGIAAVPGTATIPTWTPMPTLTPVPPSATPQPTQPPPPTTTPQPTQPPKLPTFTPAPSPTPTAKVTPVAQQVLFTNIIHDYQGWNNCGPTTVEMVLSYFGEHRTQTALADVLKGGTDDKNVRLDELQNYLLTDGYGVVMGINGDMTLLKRLLSNGFPVIIHTWLELDDGIGHYRLVIGYDENTGEFISNDSYLGPRIHQSYVDFDRQWHYYNRQYLITFKPEDSEHLATVLGENLDPTIMAQQAVARAEASVEADGSKNPLEWHNLGDSLLAAEKLEEASQAYEKALALGMPKRYFWYQFGLFETYLQLGNADRLLALSSLFLSQQESIEELHFYKGEALQMLKRTAEARTEFQRAVALNPHYDRAKQALDQLK